MRGSGWSTPQRTGHRCMRVVTAFVHKITPYPSHQQPVSNSKMAALPLSAGICPGMVTMSLRSLLPARTVVTGRLACGHTLPPPRVGLQSISQKLNRTRSTHARIADHFFTAARPASQSAFRQSIFLTARGFRTTRRTSSTPVSTPPEPRKDVSAQAQKTEEESATPKSPSKDLSEELLNLPNILTLSRIVSVPFLGYLILHDRLPEALVLLFLAGCTDLLDGWLARKWNSYTVFGSIADPAADKLLMTVMVATLGWKNLLPASLASLILLRDIGLVLLAFRIRYTSLPPPITFKRYFNPSLPSAQVEPTQISKYNTFLQLLSVGGATLNAALLHDISGAAGSYWAEMLHWPLVGVWTVTAATTVISGWGYFVGGAGYKNVRGTGRIGEAIGEKLRQARQRATGKGEGGDGR